MARWISWLSLALFLVSLFSGLVVMFAYHPSAAYESVQRLTYLIPYPLWGIFQTVALF